MQTFKPTKSENLGEAQKQLHFKSSIQWAENELQMNTTKKNGCHGWNL